MKERTVGSIFIIIPRGWLAGGDDTMELELRIKEVAEAGNKQLILNLVETQALDSTALGVLISANSNYIRRGGRMKHCQVDKRIENVFVITRLFLVFDVYPTEELAIASFAVLSPAA